MIAISGNRPISTHRRVTAIQPIREKKKEPEQLFRFEKRKSGRSATPTISNNVPFVPALTRTKSYSPNRAVIAAYCGTGGASTTMDVKA